MLARARSTGLSNVLSSLRPCQTALINTKARTKPASGAIPNKVGKTIGLPNRSAHVRFSDTLDSPVELFSILRELEKRYGAIRDYSVRPDFEVPTRYQSQIFVSFRDQEAFERIPELEDTFQVTLPRLPDRDGGPSLDDLKPLLLREEYCEPTKEKQKDKFAINDLVKDLQEEKKAKENDTEKVLAVKIWRAAHETWLLPPPASAISRSRIIRQGQEFLKWGGFNTLQPMPFHDMLPEETEIFDPNVRPDFARRRAFRNYSRILRIRNPHEIYPDKETVTEHPSAEDSMNGDDLWEPLPGTEHLTHDEAPMPSDLEFETEPSTLSNAPPYAVPMSENIDELETPSTVTARPKASSPEASRLKEFMGWR